MKKIFIILLFFYSFLESEKIFAQSANSATVVVIGNKVGFESTTIKEVKQIFRGKYSSWKNSQQVTIVLPASRSESAILVARVIYSTSVSSMQKFWLSLVFQGRFNPPIFLETDQEIITYVKKTPGSIAAISSETEGVPKNLIININN